MLGASRVKTPENSGHKAEVSSKSEPEFLFLCTFSTFLLDIFKRSILKWLLSVTHTMKTGTVHTPEDKFCVHFRTNLKQWRKTVSIVSYWRRKIKF